MPEPRKPVPVPKKGSMKAMTKVRKNSNRDKYSLKENYSVYVHKVLKQEHPNMGIYSKAAGLMNSLSTSLSTSQARLRIWCLMTDTQPSHPR